MSDLKNYFYQNKKNLIEYNGEQYYDDRIFHLHLTISKKITLPDGITTREIGENTNHNTYTLYTRRNSIGRKPIKVDDFNNFEQALKYIEKVEPEVPLISLNGKSISPKPSIKEYKKLVIKNNWLPTYIDI